MKTRFYLLILCITLLGKQLAVAQCTTCTRSYTGVGSGTDFSSLNSGETLCILANVGNISIDQNKTGIRICVAPGVTWTQTNALAANSISITVNGTFVLNGGLNLNGNSTIAVSAGASLSTNITNINAGLLINNAGQVTFTANSAVTTTGGSFTFANGAGATLTATAPPNFVAGNSTTYTNAGTMVFSSLEDSEANSFINQSTGVITVYRTFYNHGGFTNNGLLQTTCVPAQNGTLGCEFRTGDKGAKQFISNNCITVKGTVNIDGPIVLNGLLDIATGYDLSITKIVTGTNGRIVVNGGVSRAANDGRYIGTNMRFCDRNTTGNRFDTYSANYPNDQAAIVVDCSPSACSTCPTLAVTATPGACVPATNQYTLTGSVSFTNAASGELTVTDGVRSTTVSTSGSSPQSYTLTGLTANAASHTVTITSSSTACTPASVTYAAPASCSCSLSVQTFSQSGCQANGTDVTSADDYFLLTVQATAVNGSGRYELVLNANSDGSGGTVLNAGGTAYGQAVTVGAGRQLSANNSTTYPITIRDATNTACRQVRTTVAVASCSPCESVLCPKVSLTRQ
ncbi:hypothetical protein [Spirosoma sordidisoli]|uniref:Ig-like domain-containing protein n=1 Tax=Spirosoma sordidisoli TaxID=2502893 RepID=A0A4Q2UDL5_9BACT|nr:hypothetical protein [Spirosoma sordidisoli]RYC67187.1 hypothetical protein EQG79_26295 [Spirosoma sordidisoli]